MSKLGKMVVIMATMAFGYLILAIMKPQSHGSELSMFFTALACVCMILELSRRKIPKTDQPFFAIRPYFGLRQIRSVSEVRIGRKLWLVNSISKKLSFELVKVTGAPYWDEEIPCWFIPYENLTYGFYHQFSLRDMNILPYEKGQWNRNNWLERRFLFLPL